MGVLVASARLPSCSPEKDHPRGENKQNSAAPNAKRRNSDMHVFKQVLAEIHRHDQHGERDRCRRERDFGPVARCQPFRGVEEDRHCADRIEHDDQRDEIFDEAMKHRGSPAQIKRRHTAVCGQDRQGTILACLLSTGRAG
jgi:hypothetical protein